MEPQRKKSRKKSKEPLATRPCRRYDAGDFTSVFIDTLSAESKKTAASIKAKAKSKGKKNRIGQRARRKMWQELYGSNAQHLRGAKVDHVRAAESSRARGGKRIGHAPLPRRGGVANGRLDCEQSKKLKPEGSKNPRAELYKDQNASEDTWMLHPSWLASRRRKVQERAIADFQGQRTVFGDSD